MKRSNFFAVPLCVLVLCLLLCSCSAADTVMSNAAMEKEEVMYDAALGGSSNNYYASDDIKVEFSTEESEWGSPESGSAPSEEVRTGYTEKIIKNVNMSAETRDFERALDEIKASLAYCGGYEQSTSTTGKSYVGNNTYRRHASMVLRIPAENLELFLSEVGDLVNVTSQSTSSDNVTTAYYDTQARINVLESEKLAYEEMLKKAETVNDLLKIKDRLYNVIEEIEAHQTQLRVWDSKVSYSTVSLSLEEVVEYSPVVTPKDTFGTRVTKAFGDSWKSFVSGCQNLVIGLIYALPSLLITAVILGALILALIIFVRIIIRKIKKYRR